MKSFLESYLPAPADITTDDLQQARKRLTEWLRDPLLAGPEQDTRPGSVFGTWVVDPFAQLAAGLQVAVDRLRNDMDVASVAGGVAWDCDFIEAWLAGLGVHKQESTDVIGYVRLEFSSDADRAVPGGSRMVFNTEDVFLPFPAENGAVSIKRVGSQVTGPNVRVLTPLGTGVYAVVIPVKGYTVNGVAAGAEARVDSNLDIPGLTRVVAVSAFVSGRVHNSVAALARRSSAAMYASGFASRGSVRRHLESVFPDLTGVSAVVAGDPEMTRAASTALGVGSGAVDVYVRSRARYVTTQVIRLNYVVEQDNAAVGKFIGAWTPEGTPTRLDSVRWAGDVALPLQHTVFAVSKDAARAPLLSCSYSNLENLELVVEMPMDGLNQLITTSQDADGIYAWFAVTYETDPGVETVQAFVDAEGPAGVDVLVRAPMQLIIRKLVFHYSKEAGVLFNTEQAQADIEAYLSGMFAPSQISVADLNDMVYAAGASSVISVEVLASLKLSCADHVLDAGVDKPSENYAAAVAAAIDAPEIALNNVNALNAVYVDPAAGTEDYNAGAAGRRNIACTLLPGALKFHHDT